MNEQLKYQILVILKYNRNVWELIDKGYEFGQVTHFIDELRNLEYISNDKTGKVYITPVGQAFMIGFEANNNLRKYSPWILPRSDMWHKPIRETEVYIPKGSYMLYQVVAFTPLGVGAKRSSCCGRTFFQAQ